MVADGVVCVGSGLFGMGIAGRYAAARVDIDDAHAVWGSRS
ncbi:hypothetical protein [Nocardia sp. NPDC004711]